VGRLGLLRWEERAVRWAGRGGRNWAGRVEGEEGRELGQGNWVGLGFLFIWVFSFLFLIQTKFEFKYKFEFKPHSNI
jgi:hypothetical protein